MEFQKYKNLEPHIHRMASTGVTGCVLEWSDFIDELNKTLLSLSKSEIARAELIKQNSSLAAENERLSEKLTAIDLDADKAFDAMIERLGGADSDAWHDYPSDKTFKDGYYAGLAAKPVPADKPAVAVPDDHMRVSEFIDLCKSFSSRTGSIYIGDVESALSGYLSAANTFTPSHSQQSSPWLKDNQIAGIINSVRDVALTYAGTQQLRERIAGVLRPVLCGLADRCPSHESEQSKP